MEYLLDGAWYPVGKSQALSNAFLRSIEEAGGEAQLRTEVREILAKDGAAYGVRAADGKEFKSDVVVSNANAYSTLHQLLDPATLPPDYLRRVDSMKVSLSCFQVYLGLSVEPSRLGVVDHEIFVQETYDPDREYEACLSCDVKRSPYTIMVYDNVYPGFSPEGKTTLTIFTLQGYDHWQKFEDDYRKGSKEQYRTEKERMTNILIERAERIIPNLSRYIELREASTPLTNVRYTGNHRGAIYGWDQTVDQSSINRLAAETPIKNLYLAGAWTSPGGGFSGAIQSGYETFQAIMKRSGETRT
jgi:prolycopene isomerase